MISTLKEIACGKTIKIKKVEGIGIACRSIMDSGIRLSMIN